MLLIKNTLILHITLLSVSPVCNTAQMQIEEKPSCSWCLRLDLMDAPTLLFPFAIKLTWRARHQGEGLTNWLPAPLAGRRMV